MEIIEINYKQPVKTVKWDFESAFNATKPLYIKLAQLPKSRQPFQASRKIYPKYPRH